MTRTTAADWREHYAAQLGTPEEAVSIVEPCNRQGVRAGRIEYVPLPSGGTACSHRDSATR